MKRLFLATLLIFVFFVGARAQSPIEMVQPVDKGQRLKLIPFDPTPDEEIELLNEKIKYLCAVLSKLIDRVSALEDQVRILEAEKEGHDERAK